MYASKTGKTHLYQAMRHHGLSNFSFDILETCENSALDDREAFNIEKYGTFNDGYNHTTGGDGGGQLSKETIAKRSKTRKLNNFKKGPVKDRMSKDSFDKMTAGLDKGRQQAAREKSKKSHREANGGEYFSDEVKELLSKAKRGVNNPRWGGYFVTPHGVFTSILHASKLLNCRADVLYKRKKMLPDLFFVTKEGVVQNNLDVVRSPLLRISNGNRKVSAQHMRSAYEEKTGV